MFFRGVCSGVFAGCSGGTGTFMVLQGMFAQVFCDDISLYS